MSAPLTPPTLPPPITDNITIPSAPTRHWWAYATTTLTRRHTITADLRNLFSRRATSTNNPASAELKHYKHPASKFIESLVEDEWGFVPECNYLVGAPGSTESLLEGSVQKEGKGGKLRARDAVSGFGALIRRVFRAV